MGRNGDHDHLRRRRRILGLGLRPAARFLRRRHPHPHDRGIAIQQGRPHFTHLYGSCLDAQVHGSVVPGANVMAPAFSGAWGCPQFSSLSPPPPDWLTEPTMACPPVWTCTCSTVLLALATVAIE